MKKGTDTVVDWMIQSSVINEADRELYKYALYSFFLLTSPLILPILSSPKVLNLWAFL